MTLQPDGQDKIIIGVVVDRHYADGVCLPVEFDVGYLVLRSSERLKQKS